MITAVVLAAGQSLRMGQPKLLLPWQGQTLLGHVVNRVLASSVDEAILVLGDDAERLESVVPKERVRVVRNPCPAEGQSGSLRYGLAALGTMVEAAVVVLADQPFVDAAVLDTMIEAYRRSGRPIVVPYYGGQRGTPTLFARSLFPELMAVRGDKGGREVLARHEDLIVRVDFDSPLIGLDVDSWDDYQTLLGMEKASHDA